MEFEKIKSGFNLESIFIKESNFFRESNDFEFDNENLKINLKHSHISDSDILRCLVTIEIIDETNSQFKILATMVGVFRKLGESILTNDHFIKINAPAIIYPYLRQHIRNLTIDAGIKTILLPIVNFQALFDLDKEIKNEEK